MYFDFSELNERIRDSKYHTVARIACEMALTPAALYNKLQGKRCFNPQDIVFLCRLLDIRDDEIGQLFFRTVTVAEKSKAA